MFQAIAALSASVVSGLMSDRIGLPLTMWILLVTGMTGGMLLLNVARKNYDTDQRKTDALGRFSVDMD